mmetsp:Transcript_9986/g.24922  ORF Transcript_9986/g.24922 Transcript_9986/m.24922 type:complete len:92 (-) Transcript_9986:76-351(-)
MHGAPFFVDVEYWRLWNGDRIRRPISRNRSFPLSGGSLSDIDIKDEAVDTLDIVACFAICFQRQASTKSIPNETLAVQGSINGSQATNRRL